MEEREANSQEAEVQTYLLESFASGTEGLMLKALDVNATYQASKRSENWIKLKRCTDFASFILGYFFPPNFPSVGVLRSLRQTRKSCSNSPRVPKKYRC